MDLSANLDELEQHLERLTQALQQAHDDLDEVEACPPAHEDVQAISDASEQLQQVTSQLNEASNQWHAETSQLNERLADAMSALKQTLGDQQSQTEAEAGSAAHDFEEARSELDRETTRFLDEAQRALADAESALNAMLSDVQAQVSGLMDSTQSRLGNAATNDVSEAITSLTQAVEQLESAGNDVAKVALTGIKTITDGLEGIMAVLNAVKPAFEVISVIA